jgi:hypothetical protein
MGNKCVELFAEIKPKIVISHDCPSSITPLCISAQAEKYDTRTGQILEACFEAHKPDIRIHGHYHERMANLVD